MSEDKIRNLAASYVGSKSGADILIGAVELAFQRGLAEGERRGLERAAAEIDCGCPERAAVLATTTKADRCRACGREPCAAQQAADIRALIKEPTT